MMVTSSIQLTTWVICGVSEPERVIFVDEDSVAALPEVATSEAPPEREKTTMLSGVGKTVCFYSWLPQFENGRLRITQKLISAIFSQAFRRADAIGRFISGLLRDYSWLFGGNLGRRRRTINSLNFSLIRNRRVPPRACHPHPSFEQALFVSENQTGLFTPSLSDSSD
tara:strand:- start:6161 stop:6664 length:504 start_codon:yes stop_codon:yes gene_type:complete